MKLYSSSPNASIKLSSDALLQDELMKIAAKNRVEYIFESGTYDGTGSTSFIAEIFKSSVKLKKIYTVEVNSKFYALAKKNLKKYSFIECLNGLSVGFKEAMCFIKNDEALNNPEKYTDIYIDTLENPVEFYSNEIKGFLHSRNGFFSSFFKNYNDALLEKTYPLMKGYKLFILDSSGGIGLLEFTKLLDLNSINEDFLILLDDIHHLKHFRSAEYIETNSDFNILAKSVENGWLLAEFKGKNSTQEIV